MADKRTKPASEEGAGFVEEASFVGGQGAKCLTQENGSCRLISTSWGFFEYFGGGHREGDNHPFCNSGASAFSNLPFVPKILNFGTNP